MMRDFARRVASALLPADAREFILGDLEELHESWVSRHGRRAADVRYVNAVCRSVVASWLRRWPDRGYRQRRASGAGPVIQRLHRDTKYAVRQLARARASTLVAVLSLSVGITVAVTAFSAVNSMLFKPLPVEDPESMVHVFTSRDDFPYSSSTYADVADYRASGVFAGVVAWQSAGPTVTANGFAPARLSVTFASPDYFDVLGVRAGSGRLRTSNDDAFEIVLSDRYRQRTFAAGDQVIGATVHLNGQPFTVIGVTPPSFRGLDRSATTAWVPAATMPFVVGGSRSSLDDRSLRYWRAVGRLAPGITREAATARLAITARALAEAHPEEWRGPSGAPLRVALLANREHVLSPGMKEVLAVLSSVVGVVLLLACTNVAGLLLAQSVTRRHEIAVRLALGGSRLQLTAQLLTEALLLALLGGAFGVLGSRGIVWLLSRRQVFDAFDLSLDWRVLGVTTGLCVVCALLFGLTPIGHTLRIDVKSGLAGHGVVGERAGVRGRLISLQVCLSCLLVMLGMHASRGVLSRVQIEPGFELGGVVVADLDMAFPGADTTARREYLHSATYAMRSLPGVRHSALTEVLPTSMRGVTGWYVTAPDGPVQVSLQRIDPDYFETLGMPMLAGAMPRVGTVGDERPTVVVNRALAQRLGSAIIGNTIRYSRQMDAIVAGVVEDGQESSPQQVPSAAVYEVRGDWERWPRLYLVARVTTGSEEAAAAQFVQRMRDRYPAHVPPHVSNLRVQLEALFSPQRYIANAALGIGAVQLVLAALGLYSLLLYATLARMREIGLRVALGAKPRSAGLAVMKEGLHFVLTGAVLGITLGIPAAIFASRNFVGADAADPVPLAAALLGITIAAAAAAYVPMRRAARVQPMSALRQE